MIIKLGIQEQKNKSLVMPCRQGVNLGLRERILNALYIFFILYSTVIMVKTDISI
jgi:hypothetical protein